MADHSLPFPSRRRALLAAACATALAACGKESSKPAAAPEPVSIDTISAQAKGFSVGGLMLAHTAYVFFDPQCPHCAALWEESRPLVSRVRFVWIPVRLLGDKSQSQGAAILAAADPVAAMEKNEASVRAQQGGIAADGATAETKEAVASNTKLFTRFGLESVPTIVGKHAQNGSVVVIAGSLPATALAQRLGL